MLNNNVYLALLHTNTYIHIYIYIEILGSAFMCWYVIYIYNLIVLLLQIRTIDRKQEVPCDGPMCDLLWSDPEGELSMLVHVTQLPL